MDSHLVTSVGSLPSSNEENQPRVKFLCSFSGSILPRPQDGKLRYVGGETRIVSVPRDITYEDLIAKMRDIYEDASVLKYQQPDEDLDALVSVVNDDDVINMMDEYDKLGSGDGFTRLRIFLFSFPDQDGSVHFIDGDERETERRYVDALNSLSDGSDLRNLGSELSGIGTPDDINIPDQYFDQMSLENGIYNQSNYDIPLAQFNLRHLNIPRIGSNQQIDAPWSPAIYSPIHPNHDPRTGGEFPTSPSSARYRSQYREFSDKSFQYADNVVWGPPAPAAGDRSGFPGNIFPGSNIYEGNSICEHCKMTFQRNQAYPESSWKHGEHSHLEMPNNIGREGFLQVPGTCSECVPNRENFVQQGFSSRDQNDSRAYYNELHNFERGYVMQSSSRIDEPRTHFSGAGMNTPIVTNNLLEGQHVGTNYVQNEVFHDRNLASGSHIHLPSHDDRASKYGNIPYVYGGDTFHQLPQGPSLSHTLRKHVQAPTHGASPYDVSPSPPLSQSNSFLSQGYVRRSMEESLRIPNQNIWVDTSQKLVALEGSAVQGNSFIYQQNINQHNFTGENSQISANLSKLDNSIEPLQLPDLAMASSNSKLIGIPACSETGNDTGVPTSCVVEKKKNLDEVPFSESVSLNNLKSFKESNGIMNNDESGIDAPLEDNEAFDGLSLPADLIVSVEMARLEDDKDLNVKASEVDVVTVPKVTKIEEANYKSEATDVNGEAELGSECENQNNSKIEPTKAEEEAIEKGLQTIKNDDLEEIRELGSGTYGAVYHGKWRGSDVAIKRIKASCFAGRPSERERLIADFWKEALILSSLHHPNVVSFYGIVRDGPDGSLATVTEYMINGSLKQFLRKKDRTIDRRKRLILAMDAAFGMEYLHGKNIVHFDLKCENLLVNMRDPHRPVCKIGDLGLSKVKQHTLVSGGVRGTLPWMAPELLSGKSHMVTEKIDVYSFGIVMWELLTGDEPYADMHCASIIGGIVNNDLRPTTPTWCDPEWKSLMESCWASEPSDRPSFSEISQRILRKRSSFGGYPFGGTASPCTGVRSVLSTGGGLTSSSGVYITCTLELVLVGVGDDDDAETFFQVAHPILTVSLFSSGCNLYLWCLLRHRCGIWVYLM